MTRPSGFEVDVLDLEREPMLPEVAPRQQVGVLEDHPDLRPGSSDWGAIDSDLATGQVVQPGHAPEERALAAPGWAEDAEELAFRDLEREVLQSVHRPRAGLVVLGDVLDRHHDRPLARNNRGVGTVPLVTCS